MFDVERFAQTTDLVVEVTCGSQSILLLLESHDTDLDEPFVGECWDTGDRVRVSNPWACEIITI